MYPMETREAEIEDSLRKLAAEVMHGKQFNARQHEAADLLQQAARLMQRADEILADERNHLDAIVYLRKAAAW